MLNNVGNVQMSKEERTEAMKKGRRQGRKANNQSNFGDQPVAIKETAVKKRGRKDGRRPDSKIGDHFYG